MHSPTQQLEFVTLWSTHTREVYSYIYSLVANGADADDVFQETAVVLMQKFHEFDPATNFSAWACQVAYFKSLNHLKKTRRHEFLDDELLGAIEPVVRDLARDSNARLDALHRCLESLPSRDRRLIETRYRQSLTVEALAKRLNRSASTVYKSLTKIHEALLACIRARLAQGENT